MQKERKKDRRRMLYSTATAECCVNRTTCRALKHAACCRAFGAYAVDTTTPTRCSVHSFRLGTQPKAQGTQDERTDTIQRPHEPRTRTHRRRAILTTRSTSRSARQRNTHQTPNNRESARPREPRVHTTNTTQNLTNNQNHHRELGPRNGVRGPPEKCGARGHRTPQVSNTKRNPHT